MPIKQVFIYKYPNDKVPSLEEWVLTLTEEEQQAFYTARDNNYRWRQEAIDQGRMIIGENNNYIWKNEEEFMKGKPHDPVFTEFYERWTKENNIEFHIENVYEDENE